MSKTFHFKPLETRYDGRLYRSRIEARWKVFFDAVGLRADYEPEGFLIRAGAYMPDFYLPDVRMFFEVKGDDPTPDEIAKCEALSEAAECDMLLATGSPDARYQIRWFDRAGQREGLYVFAHDRFSEVGFWLLEDGDPGRSAPIGPRRSLRAHGGPVFTYVQQAYDLANAVRFERGPVPRAARVQFPDDAHELAPADEGAAA